MGYHGLGISSADREMSDRFEADANIASKPWRLQSPSLPLSAECTLDPMEKTKGAKVIKLD
eukprot:2344862-Pyramimonas_sp.AAC.1